jgi:hypothetical protein
LLNRQENIQNNLHPMNPRIILIHPPIAKPAEPPAGIAKLSSCLKAYNINHQVIDANLEGILYLIQNAAQNNTATDRWTLHAVKNLQRNLSALRNIATYSNKSMYQRVVSDVNRLLKIAGKARGVDLSLADYQDRNLKPVKSSDLICSAERPQDNPFYPYFHTRLIATLEEEPEFIGFSLNYLSQALCTFAMIGFIKSINPRQKIILGGSLATSWVKLGARSDIFNGLVDEVVAGAGEQKLLELLGIKNSQINYPPDYKEFSGNQYFAPGIILPYSSSRGCYWHSCAFCPEKSEDNPYLPLPVSQVLEELQALTRQTNPALIHLLDNAISPALLKALAQKPLGIPWYGFTRVTSHLADDDFCLALKKSGCVMLKLGIESGDQEVLDQLNKGIDLPTASAVLKSLKKAGIATYVYLLFGTPLETKASAMKTLDFVSRHHDCINFLNLAIFNLPSGSIEAQSLVTQDFYEGDLSLYKSFQHPLGWHRPIVRNFLEKTFKKHPAIALIVQRTPEFFTSNHAPFFVINKAY